MGKVAGRRKREESDPKAVLAGSGWAGLFEYLTTVESEDLGRFLVHDEELPRALSAKVIRNRVAEFLRVRKGDADELLGTSSSQLSRSDRVNSEILDRAYALSRTFERVSAVLGPEHTRSWLSEPNPGLDGQVPLELLRSRYGGERVENLVEALLNGAVV